MRYIIVDNEGTQVDAAHNKQRLYAVWDDLTKLHKKSGMFDWTVGFYMGLRNGKTLEAHNSKGKIPKYNLNEWKQESSKI